MADPRTLRRTEAAIALLGLTVVAALLPVAVDGVRFHFVRLAGAATGDGSVSLDALASVAVAGAMVLCLLRFTCSFGRRWRAQRMIGTALRGGTLRVMEGVRYTTLAIPAVRVFTTGFLRPMVFATDAAERTLSPEAFRAVLAHEASHVRRRDPLRLALTAALVDAFGWIPGIRLSAGQHAAFAELAADAEAVRSTGDARALTQALLEMERFGPPGTGIAPQRVDQLVGELRWDRASRAPVATGLAVLLALSTIAVAVTVAPAHPTVFCAVAVLAVVPILLLPAGLAAHRAQAVLRST